MPNHSETVNFIWSIADLLRDAFKRSKYPDVILPFTVLRRIDCVLNPTKQAVLATYAKLQGKLENLSRQLRKASRYSFYNTSPYTFESLCGDAKNLAANLKNYINSFSRFAARFLASPQSDSKVYGDVKNLAANLKNYINSFSDNMREVVEKFDFHGTIAKLEESGLMFLVTERFKNIDLHPEVVSNLEM